MDHDQLPYVTLDAWHPLFVRAPVMLSLENSLLQLKTVSRTSTTYILLIFHYIRGTPYHFCGQYLASKWHIYTCCAILRREPYCKSFDTSSRLLLALCFQPCFHSWLLLSASRSTLRSALLCLDCRSIVDPQYSIWGHVGPWKNGNTSNRLSQNPPCPAGHFLAKIYNFGIERGDLSASH